MLLLPIRGERLVPGKCSKNPSAPSDVGVGLGGRNSHRRALEEIRFYSPFLRKKGVWMMIQGVDE
jgi:hypothetical protein